MTKKPFLPRLSQLIVIVLILWPLAGCGAPAVTPTQVPPTATLAPISTPTNVPTVEVRADDLSEEEVATLSSLEKVDDYPLYTMHYYGSYDQQASSIEGVKWLGKEFLPHPDPAASSRTWACSLFVAMGDPGNMLYGRNFDWEYSPVLLLFTDPPDGYASVSIVDIAYLGFGGSRSRAGALIDLPLAGRHALLGAPFIPFDGMNEHGLTVGMAAVPPGQMQLDPAKETVDSLMIIREVLDHARTVEEAVVIIESHNITMGGGPPLHYLVADPSGRAVLVEFYQGEMVVISNETPWHQATNFLRSAVGESAAGECWRYDEIHRRLEETGGRIAARDAMALLEAVSQEHTQWSIVYGMSTGNIGVTIGRQYGNGHSFNLRLVGK